MRRIIYSPQPQIPKISGSNFNPFIRAGLALWIWILFNILINTYEVLDAENEGKVLIDNDGKQRVLRAIVASDLESLFPI